MKKIMENDEYRYINVHAPMWLYKQLAVLATIDERKIGDIALHAIAHYVQFRTKRPETKAVAARKS